MIYLGNKKITDLNYGGTPIKEAYYGSTLVWRKQSLEGIHNLHSWVDLGLPSGTLWANMNIGANTNYDYGDYFAWGETSKKSSYTEENYEHYGMAIGDYSGQQRFDAATSIWGGGWRTPTHDEISELDRYCTTMIIQLIDKQVCKIQGTNGKYIYMPLAGYYNGESFIEGGIKGHYWSSTPYSGTEAIDLYHYFADDLNIITAIPTGDNNHLYIPIYGSERWFGHTIRPVLDRSSLGS